MSSSEAQALAEWIEAERKRAAGQISDDEGGD